MLSGEGHFFLENMRKSVFPRKVLHFRELSGLGCNVFRGTGAWLFELVEAYPGFQ